MSNLIKIINQEGNLVVGSREVAKNFEKRHDNVLKDIDDLIKGSPQNLGYLFIESEYMHKQNKQVYREYLLTRDGFTLLAMGFTGKKALEWKLKYIEAFNKMEQALKEKDKPLQIDSKFLYQLAEQLEEKEKQIAEQQREIEHKTEVIKGVTDDIDIYTKRNVLNKVVRYKGANFAERWNELYERFREVYSVDLKARCEGYNLKQQKKKDELSVIKYAERFGYIDDLYKIALKLYETDINEILKHLQKNNIGGIK